MSTWGQLRLILQTQFPDVSLDILDSALNCRYSSALEATDWTGIKAHATITTNAAYQSVSDSVTLVVGSATVAGAGTAWAQAITGQKFYRPGDEVFYAATYVSPAALTLDRPYEGLGTEANGTVYAASPYVFMQNVYALPFDVRSVVTVMNPVTGRPMEDFTKDGLDRSAGPRTTVGDPACWAQHDDSPEPAPPANAPPVLHRIEFYPPPLRARGYPLEYLRAPYFFDGQNTSRSPLPFISDKLLLEGVRADIATAAGSMPQAMKYEASYERELGRLLLVEHAQVRVKAPVRMADRFTRHRLARSARGQSSTWRGGIPGGPV
jgi:hypothetical protein